jgi:hypothetical protein
VDGRVGGTPACATDPVEDPLLGLPLAWLGQQAGWLAWPLYITHLAVDKPVAALASAMAGETPTAVFIVQPLLLVGAARSPILSGVHFLHSLCSELAVQSSGRRSHLVRFCPEGSELAELTAGSAPPPALRLPGAILVLQVMLPIINSTGLLLLIGSYLTLVDGCTGGCMCRLWPRCSDMRRRPSWLNTRPKHCSSCVTASTR